MQEHYLQIEPDNVTLKPEFKRRVSNDSYKLARLNTYILIKYLELKVATYDIIVYSGTVTGKKRSTTKAVYLNSRYMRLPCE